MWMSRALDTSAVHISAELILWLAIDGLASVKRLSIERIAQSLVTTTIRGLAGREASTNGLTI
jgi:hypothetical protein